MYKGTFVGISDDGANVAVKVTVLLGYACEADAVKVIVGKSVQLTDTVPDE